MKKVLLCSLISASFIALLTSCATTTSEITYNAKKPSSYPILRATGYAIISKQHGKTVEEKALQAMRASKLDAYRELSEQVFGQQLIADTDLDDTVQKKNELKARTSGIIKGARVIRSYPINNTYVTELELDSKVLYNIYEMRGVL